MYVPKLWAIHAKLSKQFSRSLSLDEGAGPAPSPSQHPVILATSLLPDHSLLCPNPYSSNPTKMAQCLYLKREDTSLCGGHDVSSQFSRGQLTDGLQPSHLWIHHGAHTQVTHSPSCSLPMAEHGGSTGAEPFRRTHLLGSLCSESSHCPDKTFSELAPVCKCAVSGHFYSI